jgi:hypothetical protein
MGNNKPGRRPNMCRIIKRTNVLLIKVEKERKEERKKVRKRGRKRKENIRKEFKRRNGKWKCDHLQCIVKM